MMEGIEILNKTEIMELSDLGFTLMIVFFILTIGSGILACRKNIIFSICGQIGFLVCLLVLIIIIVFSKQPTGKYEYQVIIDDSVSLTEFYDTYEIINQEGKIWTIKEK